MITKGIENAVTHVLSELVEAVISDDVDELTTAEAISPVRADIMALIKAEAINLADQIIGKDRIIRSESDLREGVEVMNLADKAVFDFQVAQRIELAKYQNPPQVGSTGPEDMINPELSENEE